MAPLQDRMNDNENVFEVIVESILPSGARVRIPSAEGGSAWLSPTEALPDFKPGQNFTTRAPFQVNDRIRVKDTGLELGGRRRLVSLIRVENDPWTETASWEDGLLLTMEVTTVYSGGAVGLVKPGIHGRVDFSALSGALPSHLGHFERPLRGDEVAGFFRRRELDNTKRIVELDMAAYLRSRVSVRDVLAPSSEGIGPPSPAGGARHHPMAQRIEERFRDVSFARIRNVLLVDDDTLFLKGVGEFLTNHGCNVTSCPSTSEALSTLEREDAEFELALIDLHLINTRDYEGFEVARALQSRQSNCPIVFVTGQEIDQTECEERAADILAVQFCQRPFGYEELRRALSAAHDRPRPLLELLPGEPKRPEPKQPISDVAGELREALEAFRTKTRAEWAVLFSIHPLTNNVEMEAIADPENLCSPGGGPRMGDSPVRDAAIGGELILCDNARGDLKHRYLQRPLGYRSCVGVPVLLGGATTRAHCLFAFHRDVRAFDEDDQAEAIRAAEKLGMLLRLRNVADELRATKRFEVVGKTYGSMAHDLTGALSLDIALGNRIQELEMGNPTESLHAALELMRTVSEKIEHANAIIATFKHMARGQHDDVVDLDLAACLAEIVGVFGSFARSYQCSLTPPRALPSPIVVKMRKGGLQMLIYNLFLNAAQQIKYLRPFRAGEGEIVVELKRETDDKGDWAVILVHDNGPGIHAGDFEHVFDINYSTKPGGCGMGLDICRWIARDVTLGGRCGHLKVRRSILLGGSTFEVRFPTRRAV